MKMIGITTNNDFAAGLRLAGVECFVIRDPGKIKEKIKEISKDPEVGILNVTDDVYKIAKEELTEILNTQDLPLVVKVPGVK